MTSYKELLQQRELLESQIAEAKKHEYADVLAEIKQKMLDYGISAADLGLGGAAKARKAYTRSVVTPKYRDPLSGNTWSGLGKPPRWIAGKNRDDFAI